MKHNLFLNHNIENDDVTMVVVELPCKGAEYTYFVRELKNNTSGSFYIYRTTTYAISDVEKLYVGFENEKDAMFLRLRYDVKVINSWNKDIRFSYFKYVDN